MKHRPSSLFLASLTPFNPSDAIVRAPNYPSQAWVSIPCAAAAGQRLSSCTATGMLSEDQQTARHWGGLPGLESDKHSP